MLTPTAPQVRGPARPAGVTATVGLAVFGVAVLVGARRHGFISSDTEHLVHGARVALDCIHRGVWTRCAYPDRSVPLLGVGSTVRPFAILQYLPAAVLVKAGLSDGHVIAALQSLNSVAFVVTVVVLGATGRRVVGRGWGSILMAVAVAGPLACYAISGFGEMLAACMATVAIAVATGRGRRPVLLGLAIGVACLGKETFAPLLVVLAWVVGREEGDRLLPSARVIVPTLVGAAVAVGVNSAFNVFRFGTPINRTYVGRDTVVPGLRLKAVYSVAMWVSPNAGLLWFWPLAVVLLAAVVAATLTRSGRRGFPLRSWVPIGATVVVAGVFTFVDASYVVPFGWVAWGPRLLLPLMPPILLAALVAAPWDVIVALGRALRSAPAMAVFVALVAFTAVTELGAAWNFRAADAPLYVPDRTCPNPAVIYQSDHARYFRCVEDVAWRTSHLVLPAAARQDSPGEVAAVVGLVVGAAGLGVLARRGLSPGVAERS